VENDAINVGIAYKTKWGVGNLITLAKAIKLSADLLVLEEGQGSQELRIILEKIIREIVKSEMKKLSGEKNSAPKNQVNRFFRSKQIPQQDKDKIVRQIKKLLKLYGKEEV